MVAPAISFAAVDDSFDDGDIATNSLGAGTGFTTFTQVDGMDPSFVVEVGGVAILGTGPHCNFCISAIASKESIGFFGSRATWTISGMAFEGQSRNYVVVVAEDFRTFNSFELLNPHDTDAPGVYIRLEDGAFPGSPGPGFVGGLLVEDGTGAFDELATWDWSGIWDREGPLEIILDVDEIGFELAVEGNLGQANFSGVWASISSAVGFVSAWNTRDAVVGAQNQGLHGIGSMTVDRIALERPATILTIDIKPGSDPNGVNPKSKGVIPVAVLGSVDFDATQVDFSTVTFGPGEALPIHGDHVENGHVADTNGDFFDDMVLHFKVSETGIACGDTDATLTGQTFGGDSVIGTDAVKTAGCK